MPTRLLREGIIDSDRVNQLDWPAEVFYRRLMSKVDDYGLFDGRVQFIKSQLYPVRGDRVREADITRWLAECQKARLIVLYENDGKPYLMMLDTEWQRRSKPKFPLPTENSCKQLKTPVYLDEVVSGVVDVVGVGPDAQEPTMEEVKAYAASPHCGFWPDRVEEWYHDQQANGWKYASGGQGWKSRLLADRNREYWRKRPDRPTASNKEAERKRNAAAEALT